MPPAECSPGDRRKRSVFTKLMKDKDAAMRDIRHAKRFLEGMETFDSKAELLAKLEDDRELGMKRVQDMLSFINSTDDVETLLIPLLGHALNEETCRPMYQPLRDRFMLAIFNCPNLMNILDERNVAAQLSEPAAKCVCNYLRVLSKPHIDPRNSDSVKNIAKVLRERGDVNEARYLCSCLLLEEIGEDSHSARVPTIKREKKRLAAACWVTDMEPPGGRHDNDHQNYRNIRIVPTVEELTCEVTPYLPLASGENSFVEDPMAALLDKNFRLLREDALSSMRKNLSESETKSWKNARIVDIHISTRGTFSVSLVVQFEPRPNTNWKRSKLLMRGSVVALCKESRPVYTGTISVREDEIKNEWLNDPGGPKIGVALESEDDFTTWIQEMVKNCSWNDKFCRLQGKLAKLSANDPKRQELKESITAYCANHQVVTYDLVEASKSFFAYQPVLKTLQEMEAVPLAKELTTGEGSERPEYLPNEITLPEKDFGGLKIDLSDWSTDSTVAQTSLDRSQAEALRHALSSRVVLMQGPPGTGKTFMGAAVSRVIRENTDESILCVCCTNHALDQFLEHMLNAGEKRIVRIGGRSKSERLAGYQLRTLAKAKSNKGSFGQRRIKQVHAQLFKRKEDMESIIKELKTPLNWLGPSGGICTFLQDERPDIHEFLKIATTDGNENDHDFFRIVGPKGKDIEPDYLWTCWQKGESFPDWLWPQIEIDEESTSSFAAFWSMPYSERMDQIENWRREILQDAIDKFIGCVKSFNASSSEEKSLRGQSELEILKEARIIGATTSGAASYHDLLSSKAAGVVLVEEAGEVLESHVLTALSFGAEHANRSKHLILIGDHKQLPPKVENFELSTTSGSGYNLDCSLFERLVIRGLPSVTLAVQHRMRPAISAIIRSQTYPSLQDHFSVKEYPAVKGVKENLLFIDHSVQEDGAENEESTTRSNDYEADICIEMVRFLLLQGYQSNQIVVLTPYLGQLLKITAKMSVLDKVLDVEAIVSERDIEELEELDTDIPKDKSGNDKKDNGVRCSSIDNYQGEESDIVIISLVRSNKRGNIGFLKERQRVNVLLSRAKYGMFIIGNSATLLSSGKGREVWGPILDQLSASKRVLKGLLTTCQLHPDDEPLLLQKPSEFREKRPNGGCNRPCRFRLSCGHACPLKCHPKDREHKNSQRNCCEPCKRFPLDCKNNHPCSKLCKEECGLCRARVGPKILVCRHVVSNAMCYQVNSQEAIENLSLVCQKQVLYKFDCGHEALTSCANSRSTQPICPETCGRVSQCEHRCSNPCNSCDGNHKCNSKCLRVLFCGHECGRPCHEPAKCAPCTDLCHVKCIHSSCTNECKVPCASCKEPCDWECEHQGGCQLVCGAPCTRLPCNQRCKKKLACGHQCPSVCGETCPEKAFCHQCGDENNLRQIVDMVTLKSYRDHDVNAEPIIALPCNHLFTISSMDGALEMHKVYHINESGEFTGLKPLQGSDINERSKQCPQCRSIINSISRYGRILRLVELRSLERKHMAVSDTVLSIIDKKIQDNLTKPRHNEGGTEKERKQIVRRLQKLELSIRKSPMRVIFEACGGPSSLDSGRPPARQLIRCLELKALASHEWARTADDTHYSEAKSAYLAGMEAADASMSRRSGAKLRLSMVRLILKFCVDVNTVRGEVYQLLDWILQKTQLHHQLELFQDAQNLKNQLQEENTMQTIQDVMSAMRMRADGNGGFYDDNGASASSHWYECVNGHPYFIGECGGAMQESVCIECGVPVGGASHTLTSGNRQIGGQFREALDR